MSPRPRPLGVDSRGRYFAQRMAERSGHGGTPDLRQSILGLLARTHPDVAWGEVLEANLDGDDLPDRVRRGGQPFCLSAASSVSSNTRERVRKRTPWTPSTENIPPRPGTTSMMSWVWRQYSNCAAPM